MRTKYQIRYIAYVAVIPSGLYFFFVLVNLEANPIIWPLFFRIVWGLVALVALVIIGAFIVEPPGDHRDFD